MPYFDSWVQGYIDREDTLIILAKNEKDELLGMVIIEVEKRYNIREHIETDHVLA